MAVIDDVISKAQSAGKFVCKKAEDAKDFVSLEYKLSTVRIKIGDKYKELGRLYYEASVDGADNAEKSAELINEIKELLTEEENLEQQLANFKNVCPECKAVNPKNADFCIKCGKSLK